jgi:hypothetical protein
MSKTIILRVEDTVYSAFKRTVDGGSRLLALFVVPP